jgi:hypothetical protein
MYPEYLSTGRTTPEYRSTPEYCYIKWSHKIHELQEAAVTVAPGFIHRQPYCSNNCNKNNMSDNNEEDLKPRARKNRPSSVDVLSPEMRNLAIWIEKSSMRTSGKIYWKFIQQKVSPSLAKLIAEKRHLSHFDVMPEVYFMKDIKHREAFASLRDRVRRAPHLYSTTDTAVGPSHTNLPAPPAVQVTPPAKTPPPPLTGRPRKCQKVEPKHITTADDGDDHAHRRHHVATYPSSKHPIPITTFPLKKSTNPIKPPTKAVSPTASAKKTHPSKPSVAPSKSRWPTTKDFWREPSAVMTPSTTTTNQLATPAVAVTPATDLRHLRLVQRYEQSRKRRFEQFAQQVRDDTHHFLLEEQALMEVHLFECREWATNASGSSSGDA